MDTREFKVRLDFIYSLCQIAGPLQTEELSRELREWADEACQVNEAGGLHMPLLALSSEGYVVREQLSLLELDGVYPYSALLQQTLAQLEQLRASQPMTAGSRMLRARARYALVCGDHELFAQLFEAYGHADTLGWHPDRTHEFFWYEVLGVELSGGARLQHPQARLEVGALIMRAQALTALSQTPAFLDAGKLAVFYARSSLVDPLCELARQLPEMPVIQACMRMMQGHWKEAHSLFSTCFTHSELGVQLIQHQQLESALPLGILNAIVRQARVGVIQKWLDFARSSLIVPLQPWCPPEQTHEQQCSLQLLELLDHVMNRDGSGAREALAQLTSSLRLEVQTCSALVLLLLSILSDQLQIPFRIDAQILQESQQQDPLYIHYLASYQLSCDGALDEQQRALYRELVHPDIAPLRLSPQRPSHALHAKARADKQLYWHLHLQEDDSSIARVEARLLDSDDEASRRGRPLSLEKLRNGDYPQLITEIDLPVLAHIKRCYDSARAVWQLDYKGYASLAQHPRLRLVHADGGIEPLRLHAQHAGLQVKLSDEGLIVHVPTESDYRRLHRLEDGSYQVLRSTARLEQLQQMLGVAPEDGNYKLKREKHPQLYDKIAQLAGEKANTAPVGNTLPSAPIPEHIIPLLHLSYRAQRLHLTLGLRIHADSPAYFETADGIQELLIRRPQPHCLHIIRNQEEENHALARLIQYSPSLQQSGGAAAQPSQRSWSLDGLAASLQCRSELETYQQQHAPELELLWQGSEPLHLITPQSHSLQLDLRGRLHDWFEVGGHLAVDEQRVYQLRDLIRLQGEMQGRFISLGEGHYLALHEAQQRQLSFLHSSLQQKGNKLFLHRAALLSLAEHWDEQGLDQELLEHIQQLYSQLPQNWQPSPLLRAQLRPYQQLGVRWLLARARRGLGCCLADDMGLGKTLQILTLLLEQAEEGVSLIVAPLSLLRNWASEAASFTPSLRVHLHAAQGGSLPTLGAGELYLVSYGQLLTCPEIVAVGWNGVILDEAQAIKNPRARRSRAVGELQARFRVAVTGTPVENHLSDIWSLMHFLNRGLLGKYSEFLKDIQDEQRAPWVHARLAPLILRRHKEEVLTELPPLTEITLMVEFSEEERALYESHRRHALERLRGTEAVNVVNVLGELTKLRRLCCHSALAGGQGTQSAKLDRLEQLLGDLLEAGHRVLIFSQFTDVLQLAQMRLERRFGRRSLYLDGRTSGEERARLIEQFQAPEQGEYQLFFISLKAGGSGLNLTAAGYVVLLDPWWNPAIEAQAAARAHRMGQKHPVTLYRLICRGSVEEHMLRLHQQKKQLSEQIDQLSQQALMELLEQ